MSGTRVNGFGTCGFGILSIPSQIEMDTNGVMQQVGGQWIGDFGFSSGGTLANAMGGPTSAQTDQVHSKTGYSAIAYVSTGDAATAIGKGATELTYNGIPFSSANVKEGTYTFWGNAYIFAANNVGTGSEALIAYNRLSATTGINAFCDGTKAIKLTDMNCSRTGPNGDPSHY